MTQRRKWWTQDWVRNASVAVLVVALVVGAALAVVVYFNSEGPRKAQDEYWRRRAAIYAEEFQKRGLTAVPVQAEEK